ncbi:hypothetical protein F7725_024854 [Dissostichus mawsoni]|uniref:Uncharacterized protein n=1 Tax=Dissostichus mawsoni TaxID=36200 RepID=A0A7J5X9G3_DISMA|nr:hypothetical protein F7725_024854 [Dissostichus mawsoni]
MYLDSHLRVLFLILGQIVKPYGTETWKSTHNILSVDEFHLHQLFGNLQAHVGIFHHEKKFFDPKYDYDFTNFSDTAECMRGDEPYERPKGWYRMALKVKGKYPDGDTWLGTKGWRSHSVAGEWPVSYHGTSLGGARGIIKRYDYDFTDLSDSAECMRGEEPYERPKGWYRMALKVKGKYPDGDTWLGPDGWRSHSVPGEWPASYHGTSLDGARGIIKSHYKAGDGAAYGRGIYSTPDIHVAEKEQYAVTFKSKKTGKSYKVILQNRINPERRDMPTEI